MKKRAEIESIIKERFLIRLYDLNSSIDSANSMADIDEESVLDREDYSHQNEATEMKDALKNRVSLVKKALDYLERHQNKSLTNAAEGAIINTSSLIIYLGLSFDTIEKSPKNILGISTHAPIYSSIDGLGVGDDFLLDGKKITIEAIF